MTLHSCVLYFSPRCQQLHCPSWMQKEDKHFDTLWTKHSTVSFVSRFSNYNRICIPPKHLIKVPYRLKWSKRWDIIQIKSFTIKSSSSTSIFCIEHWGFFYFMLDMEKYSKSSLYTGITYIKICSNNMHILWEKINF